MEYNDKIYLNMYISRKYHYLCISRRPSVEMSYVSAPLRFQCLFGQNPMQIGLLLIGEKSYDRCDNRSRITARTKVRAFLK